MLTAGEYIPLGYSFCALRVLNGGIGLALVPCYERDSRSHRPYRAVEHRHTFAERYRRKCDSMKRPGRHGGECNNCGRVVLVCRRSEVLVAGAQMLARRSLKGNVVSCDSTGHGKCVHRVLPTSHVKRRAHPSSCRRCVRCARFQSGDCPLSPLLRSSHFFWFV